MSKKTNPTLIGIFVMGAAALSLAGLILFGGGRLFDRTFECVMYFDESIDGLDAGAPVDFQGVRIGTVKDVRLVFDLGTTNRIYRPVTMRLEDSRIRLTGGSRRILKNGGHDDADTQKILEHMVQESGMRAQLGMQSILTGKLKIELGFYPGTPVVRSGHNDDVWEMPTMPSPLQRISQEVARLPIYDIVTETHNTIKGIADIVTSADTRHTISNLNKTMENLQAVFARLDNEMGPLLAKSGATMDAAGESLRDLQGILQKLDRQMDPLLQSLTATTEQTGRMLDENSPLRNELLRALKEMTAAGRSIKMLTDYLERHPEALLRGKSEK